MSKGVSFILGIVAGVVLTLGVEAAVVWSSVDKAMDDGTKVDRPAKLPDGVSMLDEQVPFTAAKNFQVIQVVSDDSALAFSEKKSTRHFTDPIVLILSDQKNTFYDAQIVSCPKDRKVIQVGTYNYKNKNGWKTVPVIRFEQK